MSSPMLQRHQHGPIPIQTHFIAIQHTATDSLKGVWAPAPRGTVLAHNSVARVSGAFPRFPTHTRPKTYDPYITPTQISEKNSHRDVECTQTPHMRPSVGYSIGYGYPQFTTSNLRPAPIIAQNPGSAHNRKLHIRVQECFNVVCGRSTTHTVTQPNHRVDERPPTDTQPKQIQAPQSNTQVQRNHRTERS
jgi:hypothetical protein